MYEWVYFHDFAHGFGYEYKARNVKHTVYLRDMQGIDFLSLSQADRVSLSIKLRRKRAKHFRNIKIDFNKFTFPKVNNIQKGTIADSIIGVLPMKGRR